ncbi:MAG: hypothetical protein M3O32_00180 [Actinomycetota bacterium]|nr:hypothetical protein [Actinomycetota bacterium]
MSTSGTESTFNRARRTRARVGDADNAAPARPEFDQSDVARSESAAVLAALARLQLRVDLLAREQSDMFQRLMAAYEDLYARLIWDEESEARDRDEGKDK